MEALAMMGMNRQELNRAIGMWGIALCVFAAAAGWVFIRFGQAWSLTDLPISTHIGYVVPIYVVLEVALMPIGAKMADIHGFKPIFAIGASVYILGSMLSMISPTVEHMIVFRFIQGAGAGIIIGLGFSVVGRFYDNEKRGKPNELMTIAFAFGSLFGTAIGFFLTDNYDWRIGFLCFGIITAVGFFMTWFFLEPEEHDDRKPDVLNMVLTALLFGIVALYTQSVNIEFPIFSWKSLLFIGTIAVLVVLVIVQSKRSENPTIPVGIPMFEKKLMFLMFMFSLCGLGLIQYFFKLYLTYYEFDIYKASSMFIFMLAGAAVTSLAGCRLVFKTGVRPWVVLGGIIVTIALILTHFIADDGVPQFAASVFVFGIGLGCIVTEILCSFQTVVRKEDMGSHTGALMAIRMAGILVGNAIVGSYIEENMHMDYQGNVIHLTPDTEIISEIGAAVINDLAYVVEKLNESFVTVLLFMAVVTAFLAIVSYTVEKDDVKALEGASEEEDGEITEES
ncbi:MAG: MFS transporter [Thermoplasmata archaeon]|nr:MFS transporter [Thermoplasmata archaeon]